MVEINEYSKESHFENNPSSFCKDDLLNVLKHKSTFIHEGEEEITKEFLSEWVSIEQRIFFAKKYKDKKEFWESIDTITITSYFGSTFPSFDELAYCSNLTHFCVNDRLTYTRFVAKIPQSLKHAQKLKSFETNLVVEEIPDFLLHLEGLQTLSIKNYSGQSLPSWFGEMGSLQDLGLWVANVESLPDSFWQLHSLQKIDLSIGTYKEVWLTTKKGSKEHKAGRPGTLTADDLGILSTLPRLSTVRLENYFFSTLPKQWKGWETIQELCIQNHSLENITSIHLPQLKKLALSNKSLPENHTRILDLKWLGNNFSSLEEINLKRMETFDFDKTIIFLTNLKEINHDYGVYHGTIPEDFLWLENFGLFSFSSKIILPEPKRKLGIFRQQPIFFPKNLIPIIDKFSFDPYYFKKNKDRVDEASYLLLMPKKEE